jgi:hypothetical protein
MVTNSGQRWEQLGDLVQRVRPVTRALEPRRRAVLLPLGAAWPVPADLCLAITASQWEGLGAADEAVHTIVRSWRGREEVGTAGAASTGHLLAQGAT